MARIIYKDGCEGQNRLECIEGIEIELLNGQKALIYPKYKECVFLSAGRGPRREARSMREIEALKQMSAEKATTELYDLDSPAAKHVRQFKSEKYGSFNLPTLLAAMEIVDQEAAIDTLAKTIEGADLICEFSPNVWSSCRYSSGRTWYCDGDHEYIGSGNFCYLFLAVPTVLYRYNP